MSLKSSIRCGEACSKKDVRAHLVPSRFCLANSFSLQVKIRLDSCKLENKWESKSICSDNGLLLSAAPTNAAARDPVSGRL